MVLDMMGKPHDGLTDDEAMALWIEEAGTGAADTAANLYMCLREKYPRMMSAEALGEAILSARYSDDTAHEFLRKQSWRLAHGLPTAAAATASRSAFAPPPPGSALYL